MVKRNENAKTEEYIRSPVVVVMGHVDHGKTSILDWYRKTKVAAGESGGITQHIGAYELKYKGKSITFIDTPGHEAFTKLRSRGAHAADIAILVVAADEGIKPQTREAISIIRENKLPFAVALNKMDKSGANPDRVRQELAKENILVEGYGGNTPAVEISAKTGEHMDDLLEVILLLAELEELKADPGKSAEGIVIEAHMDSRRGVSATLLVLDGTLKKPDFIAVGKSVGNIKIFENFLGETIEEAGPSSPVSVTGLADVPSAGDNWRAFSSKKSAEEFASSVVLGVKAKAVAAPDTGVEKIVFNIILKADVFGSKEALEDVLARIGTSEIDIRILKSEVGDINESDVKLATATKLVTIVGFKVGVDPAVRALAEISHIRIISGDIIYELQDSVKHEISEMLPPEIRRKDLGRVKILKIFKEEGNRRVIGGRVEEGIAKKGASFEIKHMREIVGRGKITELQQNKIATAEVARGLECGMLADSPKSIEVGDVLEVFEEEVIKRTL